MALAPWDILARGKFRTDEEEERRDRSGEKGRMPFNTDWKRNEQEKAVSAALEKVAKEVGAKHVSAVAIAYVMQKAPYVFPIIGGRKVEHLKANLEALEILLSPEHIKYLESIVSFDLGFPSAMIVSHSYLLLHLSFLTYIFDLSWTQGDGSDYLHLIKNAAYMEKQPGVRAIVPDLS